MQLADEDLISWPLRQEYITAHAAQLDTKQCGSCGGSSDRSKHTSWTQRLEHKRHLPWQHCRQALLRKVAGELARQRELSIDSEYGHYG